MFVIFFLFITTTTCEWVEISQTYHRNEPRFKHKVIIDRLSEANVKYRNQSLVPQWNRGTVNKVENTGNVRKVSYASVKIPSIRPDIIETQATEPYNYRYRLKNPEESSTLKRNIFEKTHVNIQSTRSWAKTKFKNSTIYEGEGIEDEILNVHNDRHTFTTFASNFPRDISKIDNIPEEVTEPTKYDTDQGIRRIYVQKIKQTPPEAVDVEITSSQSEPIILPKHENSLKSHFNFNSTLITDQKFVNNNQNTAEKTDRHKKIGSKLNVNSTDNTPSQINKMEEVWRVVKIVADTISKHSGQSLKGKLKYLEDLKDTIIISIENHIDRVWPEDGARRNARSAHDHGHVEIPSSESTLMTISFLTFAVFLIKLVLQVIHTYKQKTMMVTPAVVAAVSRTATIFNRNH